MILRGWRIEGFGRFHAAQVDDLSGGLTVIEGPNEAGKSTLLGFLRFMLFGFQRGDSKYPPLEGGRHGGRLLFSDPQGQWELERFQGKSARLIAPDGRVLEEDALRALLGRIDGAIFKDVFAFSLWELSNLEALSQEEVRDRLYSVGLTGAGHSASSARRSLEQQLGDLLKPRAEKARINQLLSALGETRQRLREAQLQAQDYAELQHREAEAEEDADRLQREASALRARREFLLLLRSIEGTWNRLHRLESELGRTVDKLDPSLAGELQDLLDAQKARAVELEQRRGDERELTAQIEEIAPPEALVEVAPAVEDLVRGLGLQEDRIRRADEADRALQAKRGACEEIAAKLNLPSGAELPTWDFTVRQEIDDWARRLRESDEKVRRLSEQSEAALRDAARAAEDAEAAQAALAPHEGVADAAALRVRLAAIESLQRLGDAMQRRRTTFLGAGGMGVALGVVGAIGLAQRVSSLIAPLAVGFALAVYAAAAGVRAERRGRAACRQAAEEGGLSYPLPEGDLERLRREAQALQEGAADQDHLRQRAAELQAKRALRDAEAEELRRRLAHEQAQSLADQEAFGAFKRGHGLPAGLAPELLGSYAAELAEFTRTRADVERLAAEVEDTRRGIAAWQTKAQEQLRGAGREVPADPRDLLAAVGVLASDVANARTAMERAADLGTQRDGLRARLLGIEDRRSDADRRIAELLSALGAQSASEFETLREASQLRSQFLDQAGPAAGELTRELLEGDAAARSAEAEEIAQRLERIDEVEHKRALTTLLALRNEREQVAQTADVAEYAAQEERLLTELRRAVAQWRSVFAAKQLLDRTLEVYERDRQPEVLRFASQAIGRITAGRYTAVRQRSDEKGLVAVDAFGRQLSPEELSRGTAEQIYLALRLGLAASYGERVVTLPLVLDDVLVNFDPDRARAVLSVLGEFAAEEGRQALLFTCHPFVREMAEQIQGTRTLRLPQPLAAGEAAAARAPGPVDSGEGDIASLTLSALAQGELALRAIAERTGAEERDVRKQLQTLLQEGTVEAVGEGRGRRYRLSTHEGLFGRP